MSSNTSRLDRYKLNTEFAENTVTHRTIQSNSNMRQRRIEVLTTWVRERKLGAGAFGEVWLQKEKTSGNLRAVKAIARRDLRTQEVDALIDLQDVCTIVGMRPAADENSVLISSLSFWAGTRTGLPSISRWSTSRTAISASISKTIPSRLARRQRRSRPRSWKGSKFSTDGRFAIAI